MTVEFSQEKQQFIQERISAGDYSSEQDVLEEALELLMRRKALIAEIQEGYQRGKADLKAGRSREINTPEDAKALEVDILAKARALRAERSKRSR